MNSENFHEYLKNPSMLHQVSYQELKSLMLQYPYSANLRYLLLLKSLFDSKKDYDKNLVLASLSSVDRKKLWQLVQQYAPLKGTTEEGQMSEDFLELRDLTIMEEALEEREPDAPEPTEVRSKMAELKDMEEMTDRELQGYFRESEDLGFLDDIFDESYDPEGEVAQSDEGSEKSASSGTIETTEEPPEEMPGELPMLEDVIDELPGGTSVSEEEEVVEGPDETPAESREEAGGMAESPEEEPGTLPDSLEEMSAEQQEGTDSESGVPLEITNEDPGPVTAGQSGQEPEPLPKTSFSSWLQQLRPPRPGLLEKDLAEIAGISTMTERHSGEEEKEARAPDGGPIIEDKAREVAANSLLEDTDIATETLAGVLERQGHYARAIAMYEQLMLKYPEKSSFFAAKIEKLK